MTIERHFSATPDREGCPRCGSTMYYTIAGSVQRSDLHGDICRDPLCPIGRPFDNGWTTTAPFNERAYS